MKTILKTFVALAAALFVSVSNLPCKAAEPDLSNPEFMRQLQKLMHEKDSVYLQNEAGFILERADEALAMLPPAPGNTEARTMTLMALDLLAHDKQYWPLLKKFGRTRIAAVPDSIGKPLPASGIRIHKLYNDGFIAEGGGAAVAVDVNRMRGNMIDDSTMTAIARKCDALLITHQHHDHFDSLAVKSFVDAGKTVVLPDVILPGEKSLTHVRDTIMSVNGCEIRVFPGHQGEFDNNLYLLTFPNGRKAAFLGDQYGDQDSALLRDIQKEVGDKGGIDVLAINNWMWRFGPEVIRSFNPATLLMGHENELDHAIERITGYWQSYQSAPVMGPGKPFVVMTFGESVQL